MNFFIFFSRTTKLPVISTNLGTKYLGLKGIQVCLNEEPRPFPREDSTENRENTIAKLINLFIQRQSTNISLS